MAPLKRSECQASQDSLTSRISWFTLSRMTVDAILAIATRIKKLETDLAEAYRDLHSLSGPNGQKTKVTKVPGKKKSKAVDRDKIRAAMVAGKQTPAKDVAAKIGLPLGDVARAMRKMHDLKAHGDSVFSKK